MPTTFRERNKWNLKLANEFCSEAWNPEHLLSSHQHDFFQISRVGLWTRPIFKSSFVTLRFHSDKLQKNTLSTDSLSTYGKLFRLYSSYSSAFLEDAEAYSFEAISAIKVRKRALDWHLWRKNRSDFHHQVDHHIISSNERREADGAERRKATIYL